MPEVNQPDLFSLAALASRGGSVSVTDAAGSWTGTEAAAAARSMAGALCPEGRTGGGARVVIDLPAGRQWFAAAAGAWLAGFCVVPVDRRWPAARRKIAEADSVATVDASNVSDMIALPAGLSAPAGGFPGRLPAVVLQTSGSAGRPKEIVHTRSSVAAQSRAASIVLELGPADTWLDPLPLAHAGGIGVIARCLHAGAAIDLRDGGGAAGLGELLADPSSGPTLVSLVPTQLRRIIDQGFSSPGRLRALIVGGAALPADLAERAEAAHLPLRPSWGMTEALGLITLCRGPADSGCGRPLPGLEVAVSGGAGTGELLVRGDSVPDYLRDENGWFATGDSGRVVDGCVEVDGRIGAMIISGGENVSPPAVEAALCALPAVVDAHVRGEPDPDWGEKVVARIVRDAERGVDSGQLREMLAESLAPWEIPKVIEFVDKIERDPMGKVVRGDG